MSARLKLTRPEPSEATIQAAVRTALLYHPAVLRVFRVNSGAHVLGQGRQRRFVRYHTIDGMSDLWAWLKPAYGGRQAFVEVKRASKVNCLTEDQMSLLLMAKACGHIAFVATGVDQCLAEFERQLKGAQQ